MSEEIQKSVKEMIDAGPRPGRVSPMIANCTKKRIIYISGPMSGIEDHNFPAFNAAAADLRARGYEVLNPAENDSGSTHHSWEFYMKQDIPNVCKSDAVVTLPGWE